jgi:hypothetical protein
MADALARRLSGSLAAAAISLALLGGVVHGADTWLERKARAFRQARSSLAEAANQYRSASDDRAVYQQYAKRFRDMDRRGWIGKEQRLSWIEGLQAINKELKLPVLRYDIGQRTPVALSDAPFDASRLHLYRTPMKLEISALHEYDITTLLQRLSEKGQGLMALSSCNLDQPGPVRVVPGATNVEAECALDWYTLGIDPAKE